MVLSLWQRNGLNDSLWSILLVSICSLFTFDFIGSISLTSPVFSVGKVLLWISLVHNYFHEWDLNIWHFCCRAFGYSSEDVQMVIETMASQGKEPTFCMGDDIPLAILSQRPHMLYDYFKQRFAQVCHLTVSSNGLP